MFLEEARLTIKMNPEYTLPEFNQMFKKWVNWYNTEKPHRSLRGNNPPSKRYFNTENRIIRPLKANVNWKRWLYELERGKVNK
ncbi:MAG: integrase core domain-containing protein [Candidatus Odinarchaeota archaeon]